LFGELHVALLKSIIKDIEDVARTSSVVSGVNQSSSANPGGGHPQIVEGVRAYLFYFLEHIFALFETSSIRNNLTYLISYC
jgi:hypothetical protein